MAHITMTTTTSAKTRGPVRIFDDAEPWAAIRPVHNVLPLVANRDMPAAPDQHHKQTESASERFMQIVQGASNVDSHYDLYRLLQDKIQYFIPHQILISAWRDFSDQDLTLDVVSALPGVRTELLAKCGLESLLKGYFDRYAANGRQPLRLNGPFGEIEKHAQCDCAIHTAIHDMRSVQIFGLRNERDNQETLYVAFSPSMAMSEHESEYRSFLINSVVAQIDMAFRKVAALKIAKIAANDPNLNIPKNLSTRELEVLAWLTQGKSNSEIAEHLNISAFTVKNHAQRIFKKLKVTNRAEVAAMYNLVRA